LQGVIFGAMFTNIRIENGVFIGNGLDFLTQFTILTGIATFVTYSILGLCYLKYKTVGEIAEKATKMVKPLLLLSFVGTFLIEEIKKE
jgi:cytochrome bd ubiquinol oxidase subunit II